MNKWIYWLPRILSILFLLFLAIFSFDVFDSCNGFLDCALGLLMHNLPVIILAVLLWISWRREIVGAYAFFIGGLLYIVFILMKVIKTGFEWYYLAWFASISVPAFVIGILWFLNWRIRKRLARKKRR